MVGDAAFAQFVTNQSSENYRVTHTDDIVPKVPTYILGYRHVSPEYWIRSADNVAVAASDVSVSYGIAILSGNCGTLSLSVDAHLWYFNSIASCSPSGLEL